MVPVALRNEALKMLHGEGQVLQTARAVSRLLKQTGVEGAIIGGVAVVLHGYVRTTIDVDVYVPAPVEPFAEALEAHGFLFDPVRREFLHEGVPVPLVLLDQLRYPPRQRLEVDEICTVSLADLIEMKLRSGTKNLVRAIDLADVIGLIRCQKLTAGFARQLPKDLRPEFRKLVRAVADS